MRFRNKQHAIDVLENSIDDGAVTAALTYLNATLDDASREKFYKTLLDFHIWTGSSKEEAKQIVDRLFRFKVV